MTEDEAKTRWCPFIRIAPATESHHAVTNREDRALDIGPVTTNCIGSSCMAWRWLAEQPIRNGVVARTEGFCGLAGRPG